MKNIFDFNILKQEKKKEKEKKRPDTSIHHHHHRRLPRDVWHYRQGKGNPNKFWWQGTPGEDNKAVAQKEENIEKEDQRKRETFCVELL